LFFSGLRARVKAAGHRCHYSSDAGMSNGEQNQAVVDK